MTDRKKSPERYRRAYNLKEGMEVRDAEGTWWPIMSILNIAAPLQVVRVEFSDGEIAPYHPQDQVMSR